MISTNESNFYVEYEKLSLLVDPYIMRSAVPRYIPESIHQMKNPRLVSSRVPNISSTHLSEKLICWKGGPTTWTQRGNVSLSMARKVQLGKLIWGNKIS